MSFFWVRLLVGVGEASCAPAVIAAGTSQMTDAFRAVGLQSAMALVVPLAIALTCISLFFAARSFIADAGKTASVGKPTDGLATAS
jgi:hypothetical protein